MFQLFPLFYVPSFHTYIIPHYVGFVKRFSKNICNYFSYTRYLQVQSICYCFTLVRTEVSAFRNCISHLVLRSVPLLTLLLYHKSGSLSRGFEKFLTIYFTLELCEVLRITHLFYQFTILVLLTTLILYHTIGKMSSSNVAQSFSGKMARSVQDAQKRREPVVLAPSGNCRKKKRPRTFDKVRGKCVRGLSRGKSD